MANLKIAFSWLANHSVLSAAALTLGFAGEIIWTSRAFAELAVHRVEIAPVTAKSRVPEATVQGRFLAPQAVSALHVSLDGGSITVGTMGFSHDANVWQFASDGTILARRYFPPWAPMQVATLSGGQAAAVGLAYSRVTSPEPTVWFGQTKDLFASELRDQWVEADPSEGQMARWRPGSGDWRTGWMASQLGELFLHGPDWIFKPPVWWMNAEGRRQHLRYEDRNLLPTGRALRMAASADGRRVAFGWLAFGRDLPKLPTHADVLSVWQVNPNRSFWSAQPLNGVPPPLPDPAADFPDELKNFRLGADLLVPSRGAAAVALNRDGSHVAFVEYGVWAWIRTGPAIGKWDPPIHTLNFLPKQRGRLRVFDNIGQQLCNRLLPEAGMFEVGFGRSSQEVWCWPASWFARGMAGAPWLPVDRPARTIYRVTIDSGATLALSFPDAVADCAISAANDRVLISCWDGQIRLLDAAGGLLAAHDVGGPARVVWSSQGAFGVAGTADGRLFRLEANGALGWSRTIPANQLPPLTQAPREVAAGLPVFQGGRIPQGEHAYVGDIWMIKSGRNAVLVDAGGLSGFSVTQARLRVLGIERVTHVLQTHSHGDHCGGAYLWRAAGAQIVGAKVAGLTLTWLMPMLSDYGIYPPRPLDLPLPLSRVGDEAEFEVAGLKFRALFLPGHSFDHTVYMVELNGKRIAFTGDLGFENQDMIHRCWGDVEKAQAVLPVVRQKLLSWRPVVVFTGHGVRTNGMQFLERLIQDTEKSLWPRGGGAPAKRVSVH